MENRKFFNMDMSEWREYFTKKYNAETADAFENAVQRYELADKESAVDGHLNAWTQFAHDLEDAKLTTDRKENGYHLYNDIVSTIANERERLNPNKPNLASAFKIQKNIGNVTAVLSQTSDLCACLVFVDRNDPTKRVSIPPNTLLTEYFGDRVAPHHHQYDIRLDQTFVLYVGNEKIHLPTIAFH